MKVKSILVILCLIAGVGLNQLSAQNFNPKGNSFWIEQGWGTRVYCDGIWVDFISGYMKCHAVEQYKDGVLQRQIVQTHGEAFSWVTGEKFKYKEITKWYPLENISAWRYNLLGEDGSHYTGTIVLDMGQTPWIYTPGECKCF
jgi:hypothetical protein